MRLTIGPGFNHILCNIEPCLAEAAAFKLDQAIKASVLRLTNLTEAQ